MCFLLSLLSQVTTVILDALISNRSISWVDPLHYRWIWALFAWVTTAETCYKSPEKELLAPFPWSDHTKRTKIEVFENKSSLYPVCLCTAVFSCTLALSAVTLTGFLIGRKLGGRHKKSLSNPLHFDCASSLRLLTLPTPFQHSRRSDAQMFSGRMQARSLTQPRVKATMQRQP